MLVSDPQRYEIWPQFLPWPGRMYVYSLGPASQDPKPYSPPPYIDVNVSPQQVVLTWPATVPDAIPQWSPDMRTWHSLVPTTNRRRSVLPGS